MGKLQLPKADHNGNYWLTEGDHMGMAILHSGVHARRWMASRGKTAEAGQDVILMTRTGIWYFDSPEDALRALHYPALWRTT